MGGGILARKAVIVAAAVSSPVSLNSIVWSFSRFCMGSFIIARCLSHASLPHPSPFVQSSNRQQDSLQQRVWIGRAAGNVNVHRGEPAHPAATGVLTAET